MLEYGGGFWLNRARYDIALRVSEAILILIDYYARLFGTILITGGLGLDCPSLIVSLSEMCRILVLPT